MEYGGIGVLVFLVFCVIVIVTRRKWFPVADKVTDAVDKVMDPVKDAIDEAVEKAGDALEEARDRVVERMKK